jgi:DNA ligase-1
MKKLETLMLAQNYNPAKHKIGGWFISEKFDGSRCLAEPITRGMNVKNIPWANTFKDKKEIFSTGLWSRSFKPIFAPNFWLDQLPNCFLDGELFTTRGNFQSLRKIVAKHEPNLTDWKSVKFKIFDSPTRSAFSTDREIKVRSQYSYKIEGVQSFLQNCNVEWTKECWLYEHVYSWLNNQMNGPTELIYQEKLPADEYRATERLKEKISEVLELGGEGVVLRDPMSRWQPVRSHNLLKCKPINDAEGTLIGFTSGRETDRGSKLRGKIGALILDVNGIRLELSGLTDEEREFETIGMVHYAQDYPGTNMPAHFRAKYFNLGDLITFKYREKTDEGNYKEARYLRKRV